MATVYILHGHQYCAGCVECDSPCLGEGEREAAEVVDSRRGYCNCCGADVSAPESEGVVGD